ncbi:hypothetical protein HNR67_002246 [Crossiella cryophila]|uniref:Uncharacterized protein n=1 Tax=Crossiella cryophila TaxID=43355 RepID=A0A7W7CA60_9PSEU|nr:hypothetical protein [Crossiella cryophila]
MPPISWSGSYLDLSRFFPERADATVAMNTPSATTAIGTPTRAGTGEPLIVGDIIPSPNIAMQTRKTDF